MNFKLTLKWLVIQFDPDDSVQFSPGQAKNMHNQVYDTVWYDIANSYK